MSENQRALQTMSKHVAAEYIIAMQDFTNITYTGSEQQKDLREARLERDAADLDKISSKLPMCSPFSSLRSVTLSLVLLVRTV